MYSKKKAKVCPKYQNLDIAATEACARLLEASAPAAVQRTAFDLEAQQCMGVIL
jgi:hypothetical protein